jgi:hypothetical protein
MYYMFSLIRELTVENWLQVEEDTLTSKGSSDSSPPCLRTCPTQWWPQLTDAMILTAVSSIVTSF